MRILGPIITLLLAIPGLPAATFSGSAEVREKLAEAVISAEEKQIQILEDLIETGDPFVSEVLTAWRRGELFLIEHEGSTIPALLGNADSKEPVKVFILESGELLKDKSGKELTVIPSQQKAAETTRTLRIQFKRTSELLGISNPDPKLRAKSAFKLGSQAKPEYFAALKNRLVIEKNSRVIKKLKEGMAISQLRIGDEKEKAEAAAKLGELRSIGALDRLKKIVREQEKLAEDEKNNDLVSEATRAVKTIEDYKRWVDRGETAFRGINYGAVLLIVSLGLAITFGLMGVINMAHGEMIAIGGYSAYVMQKWMTGLYGDEALQWYFLLAIPFAFLTAATAGLLMERSVIRFLYRRPLESLLATWAVSMILQQCFRLYFGAANVQVNSPDWLIGSVSLGDMSFNYNRLFVIVFAAIIVLGTWFLMAKTPLGLSIRAVMQNRDMAASIGIRASRVRMVTFAFGSGLAGLAGCFLSQIDNVGPEVGSKYIIDSFMVVVSGGVGNLLGTITAALGIGTADRMLEAWSDSPVVGKVMVLSAIIVFLQVRPGGLFAAKSRSLD